ncbi:branched-chain amino acid ABC transporter permease [Paracoccus sp. SSJ]|uniref:branched-chain amino acid ABC transporter permease n=1 Tax=Paracoccus sp. SSJ TaxID=3050636 RepID=UPI00254CDF7F|nr:branched-chain amino acid ABC transporter permease [Paracoccus sp. SSJ]MDK8873306.1 branched-chain amino acid ABC transporter permease [Paracoccus sp. SSJ]
MTAMRRDLLLYGLFACVALFWPMISGMRYSITQTTFFFIWATVVVQWNLVFGIGGIFSLAQVAIFAIGAYVTAMLGYYLGTSMLLAMPAGAVVAVVASIILGIACLRLYGPYVALLTICVSQVLYVLIVNDTDCFTNPPAGCMPLMGGVRGFSRFGDLGFRDWLGAGFYVGNYYVGLLLLSAAILFSIMIIHSPMGLAFRALRDNPVYAAARGVDRFRYQLWIFGLSAFFTGLAGAFYAVNTGVVGPVVFSFQHLLFLLSMIIVGGIGTVWGPVIGAAVLMLADEAMRELGDFRDIGMGLILVACVVLMPRGLTGLFHDISTRLAKSSGTEGEKSCQR